MSQRCTIAIDVGEHEMRAVEVRFGRGTTIVARALTASLASDVDPENAEERGRQLGDALRRAGFPTSGDAVVLLDRGEASLRRVELPTDDDTELPEMARLAAQRETPAEAGPLVVDAIPRERLAASMVALAAAAPERLVNRCVRTATVAGFKPLQCTLATFGIAWLLREREHEGTVTIAFDCAGDTIEFVVVRDGEIVHSRGARVDPSAGAEALATEAKRSWMSWRLSDPDVTVGAAVLFGDEAAHAAATEALGKSLGAPLVRFDAPSAIGVDGGVDRSALDRAWPLIGVLLEAGTGEETINFVAPRKAPDLAARRRSRVLMALGAVTVCALLGWTAGRQSWRSFLSDVAEKKETASAALPKHTRFKRDQARLAHLTTWESARPDWLDHLRFLAGFADDSNKVVLDSWTGTLEVSDVQLSRDGKWSVAHEIKIVLEGEAKDRAIADGLRDALVDNAHYSLTSTGPDTEGGRRLRSPFSYVLRSNDPKAPEAPAAKSEGAAK
ncbi:MAG: hypothetical protein U0572_07350 [Phycisphaerales bacterium]